tara:strand:- start:18 stop:434 length:417 start_codon:yes stop_codon:yes gene_type:complete
LNNKISNKDKEDWEKFTNSKEKLTNKDNSLITIHKRKEKILDLHGYSLLSANRIVENLITNSFNNHIYKLKIITGKGLHSKNDQDPYISKELGILKNSVPKFIESNKNLMKMVSRIESAKIEDGGDGAIYIFLKKNKK